MTTPILSHYSEVLLKALSIYKVDGCELSFNLGTVSVPMLSWLGGGVITLVCVWVYVWGKKKLRGDEAEEQPMPALDDLWPSDPEGGSKSPAKNEPDSEPQSDPKPEPKPPVISTVAQMEECISEMPSDDLSEWMSDLLEEVKEDVEGDDVNRSFIIDMADRCGDIDLLLTGDGRDYAELFQRFRELIVKYLKTLGVELLHSDEWNPAIQRAVRKKEDDEISKPKISRHVSPGISIKGKLLRKEEVALLVPKTKILK